MGNKNFELYVGLDKRLTNAEVKDILRIVQSRHPGVIQDEVLEGYWSGVEETTLLFKVETTISYLLETVDAISSVYKDVFVAIDEPDN